MTPVIPVDSPRIRRAPVLICDPPVGKSNIFLYYEIVSIYKYYENLLLLILQKNDFLRNYLSVTYQLEISRFMPIDLLKIAGTPLARYTLPKQFGKDLPGTWFDRRLFLANVKRYKTFKQATKTIKWPTYFIGLDPTVLNLLQNCKIKSLLAYSAGSKHAVTKERYNSFISLGIASI